jgi:nicotinamide-nucleotide amidase
MLILPAWILPFAAAWEKAAYAVLAIAVAITVVTGLDYLHQAHRLRRTSPRAMAKRAEREARRQGPSRRAAAGMTPEELTALAAECLALLRHRGETLGCAESLTGGALAAAVVSVPGASLTFRGAVVSYAVDVKIALLGVDAGTHGPAAARSTLGSSPPWLRAYAVWSPAIGEWPRRESQGPAPAEGKEAGTAYVAVCGPAEAGQQGRSTPARPAPLPSARCRPMAGVTTSARRWSRPPCRSSVRDWSCR